MEKAATNRFMAAIFGLVFRQGKPVSVLKG
jgi:hypothetical protein